MQGMNFLLINIRGTVSGDILGTAENRIKSMYSLICPQSPINNKEKGKERTRGVKGYMGIKNNKVWGNLGDSGDEGTAA